MAIAVGSTGPGRLLTDTSQRAPGGLVVLVGRTEVRGGGPGAIREGPVRPRTCSWRWKEPIESLGGDPPSVGKGSVQGPPPTPARGQREPRSSRPLDLPSGSEDPTEGPSTSGGWSEWDRAPRLPGYAPLLVNECRGRKAGRKTQVGPGSLVDKAPGCRIDRQLAFRHTGAVTLTASSRRTRDHGDVRCRPGRRRCARWSGPVGGDRGPRRIPSPRPAPSGSTAARAVQRPSVSDQRPGSRSTTTPPLWSERRRPDPRDREATVPDQRHMGDARPAAPRRDGSRAPAVACRIGGQRRQVGDQTFSGTEVQTGGRFVEQEELG